ncbi:hypothetical protein [Streptomyces griseorubiginosus]|uniref:hypothetical protein n=1 Tax=Streptomyces griseorubiginosus TaxID=67304 RepID=UPI0036E03D0B
MPDVDASTLNFLAQLRTQTEALRQGAEVARRERDEAAVRLADLEKKLADSTAALRALEVYTGEAAEGSATTDSPAGPDGTQAQSIEEAILRVLREEEALTPLEIARTVEALGVSSSASSVRARLSKLVKLGTLQRDGMSRYSVSKAESGATKD